MRLADAIRLGMILARDAPHHAPGMGKFRQICRIRTNKTRVDGQQIGL